MSTLSLKLKALLKKRKIKIPTSIKQLITGNQNSEPHHPCFHSGSWWDKGVIL